MAESILGIYGSRGHGRDLLLFARDDFSGEICFVDDDPPQREVLGVPVVSFAEFEAIGAADKQVALAVADGDVRERLFNRAVAADLRIKSLVSGSSKVWSLENLGQGCLLSPFSAVSAGSTIGKCVHLNTMVSVAHDCKVEDFVTFGPGAKCNGCVNVGKGAYIGSGALIKQGTLEQPRKIGAGAIVGMGAVVVRDVAPGEIVVGNPAKPIQKKGL